MPLQRSATSGHPYVCSYGTTGGCAHTSTAAYACDFTNYSQTAYASYTLNPGVYCGGIKFGGVNAITFNPGVYILDGGGMSIGPGGGVASVTGTGVNFYSTGTNSTYAGITITNGVQSVQLSAPTSGSMAGLVYYQDPSLSPAITAPKARLVSPTALPRFLLAAYTFRIVRSTFRTARAPPRPQWGWWSTT